MSDKVDKEVHKEISNPGLLSRIVAQEAILVLLLSGVAYLCAYYYKRSYLESFGVDRVYVYIDLVDLVVAAAAILAIVAAFIQPALIFPPNFFMTLAGLLMVNIDIVTVGAFFALLLMYVGVTWATAVLFVILELLIIYKAVRVLLYYLDGRTMWDYFGEQIELEISVRSRSTESAISGLVGDSVWLFVLVALFIPHLFGTWAGAYMAGRKHNFMVMSIDGKSYASVSPYGDGLLLSRVEEYESNRWSLSKPPEVIWLSNEGLSGMIMLNQRFPLGIEYAPPTHVQSFADFWQNNFGHSGT